MKRTAIIIVAFALSLIQVTSALADLYETIVEENVSLQEKVRHHKIDPSSLEPGGTTQYGETYLVNENFDRFELTPDTVIFAKKYKDNAVEECRDGNLE